MTGPVTNVTLTRGAEGETVAGMSAFPVAYQQTPAVDRSRLTVFFRLIMAIPHMFMAFFYGIAAAVVVFIA